MGEASIKMLVYVLASLTEITPDSRNIIRSRKLLNSIGGSEDLNYSPPPLYSLQGRIQFNPLTFRNEVTSIEGDVILFDRTTLEGFNSSEMIQLQINVTYPATTGGVIYGGISYVNSSVSVGIKEIFSSDYYEVGGRSPYVYPNLYGYKDEIELSVIRGKGVVLCGTQGDLNQVLLALLISPPKAFTGLFNIKINIIYPSVSNDSHQNLAMNLYIVPITKAPIATINYVESDSGGSISTSNNCNMSASSLFQLTILHTDLNCYKSLYSIRFSSNISAPSHYFMIHDSSIDRGTIISTDNSTNSPEFLISTSTTGNITLNFRVCYPAGIGGGDTFDVGTVVKYLGCPNINGDTVSVSSNATTVFKVEQDSVSPTILFNTTHKLCEEDQPCELPTFSITVPLMHREVNDGSKFVVVANLSLLYGRFLLSSISSDVLSSLGLSVEIYLDGRTLVVKGESASNVELYVNTLYYQPDLNFNGVWQESGLKEKIILDPLTELEILTATARFESLVGAVSSGEDRFSTAQLKISVSWNNDAVTISFPPSSTFILSNTSGNLYPIYALNITEEALIFLDIIVRDVDLDDVVKKTYNESLSVEATVQCNLIDGGLISMPLISLVKSGSFLILYLYLYLNLSSLGIVMMEVSLIVATINMTLIFFIIIALFIDAIN
jgi:hypothetical protein